MGNQLFEHLPFVSFSMIASAMSMMFCIILWRRGSEYDRYSKYLLMAYLLFVSFRLLKWMHNFIPEDFKILFANFSFAIQILLGPLANIYINTFADKVKKIDILHCFPSLLMILFIGRYDSHNWDFGSTELFFVATYWVLHGIWGVYFVRTNTDILSHNKKWLRVFSIGNLIIAFVYFMYGAVPLLTESLFPLSFIISLIVFAIVYWQTESSTNLIEKKIRNKELPTFFEEKLNEFLSSKEYLNPDLSLNDMAKKLNVQAYQLSQILNDQYGQSFSEFINKKRIDKACQLLKDPEYNNVKIASLSMDCGFNTLSAFNSSFKKYTGNTPTEFRKS